MITIKNLINARNDKRNDYALINNLLTDNSKQSLLKLKTIVIFTDINICRIEKNNFINFVKLFKNEFKKYVFDYQYLFLISEIPKDCVIEFVKLFKDDFEKLFTNQKYAIELFHEDCTIEILLMFKDVFNDWLGSCSSVRCIHKSKRYEVHQLFPQFRYLW